MGVSSFQSVYARYRYGPCRSDDRTKASSHICRGRTRWCASTCVILGYLATAASAETIRVALFTTDISRDGPGLLLRDILRGEDPRISATIDVITHISPDVLVLAGFDYDLTGAALDAFAQTLAQQGTSYPYFFAARPNTGMHTGLDLDGDGRTGQARDAQGYGRFSGDAGLAVLSKFAIQDTVFDFSDMLWADFPKAQMPVVDGVVFPSPSAVAVQWLSTTAHWDVPITLPDGSTLRALTHYATPPIFDGPEDRNGLRNRDELRFWQWYLKGDFGTPSTDRYVLFAAANLDPVDGDGRGDAMQEFLTSGLVQDPEPSSAGGRVFADRNQAGDPALDTADWQDNRPAICGWIMCCPRRIEGLPTRPYSGPRPTIKMPPF